MLRRGRLVRDQKDLPVQAAASERKTVHENASRRNAAGGRGSLPMHDHRALCVNAALTLWVQALPRSRAKLPTGAGALRVEPDARCPGAMPTVDTAVKPDNRMMRNQIEFRTALAPPVRAILSEWTSKARRPAMCGEDRWGPDGVYGPTGAQNQGLDPLAEVEREDRCAQSDLVHTV